MTKDVSVILCSYNRSGMLSETLCSFQKLYVPDDLSVELLLIDNVSVDDTTDVMKNFNHPQIETRIFHASPKGLSNARNRGIAECSGKVLLFTDDDVRFPEDWIPRMAGPILSGMTEALAGGVHLHPDLERDWFTPKHRELLASTERLDEDNPDRLVGANMAVSREVFNVIPGFDPELGAGQLGVGEETLFSGQLREANFQISGDLSVAVEHRPAVSRLTRNWFQSAAKNFGRSEAYISYHWKHRKHNIMLIYMGILFFQTALKMTRAANNDEEVMTMKEFQLLRKLHRLKMHEELHGQDYKYDHHGLVKKHK